MFVIWSCPSWVCDLYGSEAWYTLKPTWLQRGMTVPPWWSWIPLEGPLWLREEEPPAKSHGSNFNQYLTCIAFAEQMICDILTVMFYGGVWNLPHCPIYSIASNLSHFLMKIWIMFNKNVIHSNHHNKATPWFSPSFCSVVNWWLVWICCRESPVECRVARRWTVTTKSWSKYLFLFYFINSFIRTNNKNKHYNTEKEITKTIRT